MLAEKRMIFFICLAQLRCPCKGKPWGWDPAGCCRGCQRFSVLPMSAWSPLLLPWPLPAAWWCQLLTLCINPSLSAFQALPWARDCSYSTQKLCSVPGREKDQRREDTLHQEHPRPLHGMPPWAPAIHQSLLQSQWCQLGFPLMSFGACCLPARRRSLHVSPVYAVSRVWGRLR